MHPARAVGRGDCEYATPERGVERADSAGGEEISLAMKKSPEGPFFYKMSEFYLYLTCSPAPLLASKTAFV